jgi:hypothetical protein
MESTGRGSQKSSKNCVLSQVTRKAAKSCSVNRGIVGHLQSDASFLRDSGQDVRLPQGLTAASPPSSGENACLPWPGWGDGILRYSKIAAADLNWLRL